MLRFQPKLTLWDVADEPLPVSPSEIVEPLPVVNFRLALAVPLDCGLKVTVYDLL